MFVIKHLLQVPAAWASPPSGLDLALWADISLCFLELFLLVYFLIVKGKETKIVFIVDILEHRILTPFYYHVYFNYHRKHMVKTEKRSSVEGEVGGVGLFCW